MSSKYLVLEDGTVYEGKSFGYDSDAFGEVIFNTEESAYQRSLTDPSYKGHIVVMTYPLIGNYRVHDKWFHSDRVQAGAVICREYCDTPADMYPGITFGEYLAQNKVPGITGVDTRDLTLRIRNNGTMRGMVVSDASDVAAIVSKIKATPFPCESNLVADVSPKAVEVRDNGKEITVGVIDCGEMEGTLKALGYRYNVIRFPYNATAEEIMNYTSGKMKVQGVVVCNGPGNPAHPGVACVVETVKALIGKMPLFGLGLGHQLIAIAFGAKTYKMKFGHHGVNEPVLYRGRTFITAQNHCYAVDAASLEGTGLVADQLNINDRSVEGMKGDKVVTVQYLPETTEEEWENSFIFDELGKLIKEA